MKHEPQVQHMDCIDNNASENPFRFREKLNKAKETLARIRETTSKL